MLKAISSAKSGKIAVAITNKAQATNLIIRPPRSSMNRLLLNLYMPSFKKKYTWFITVVFSIAIVIFDYFEVLKIDRIRREVKFRYYK